MALTPGTRLGPYEVLSALGAGGMGEVYRARDTTLNRDVALKVIPDALAGDPDRLARFRREAEALAALNHPNIAHIYGFERVGAPPGGGAAASPDDTRPSGHFAIVMELVEGRDLSEVISGAPGLQARGLPGPEGPGLHQGMPMEEALAIARQIAEALEAAHERGIIHRDLKPANVKVKDDGTVKLLDFGLAKALAPEPMSPAAEELANSPTLTARATQMGVILGTAAYMAPEQAKGKPVDHRVDIWAFGVVLFEMLTGRRPFVGDDASDVLAAVIKSDPDWSALPADLSPALEACLRRCLEKDRRQRVQAIGDARLLIDGAFDGAVRPAASAIRDAPRTPGWPRAAAWGLAGAIAGGLAIGLVVTRLSQVEPPKTTRFTEVLPEDFDFVGQNLRSLAVAVSPDGSAFVYSSDQGVYLRQMDALEAIRIPGTEEEEAGNPVFSPDGRWLAYYSYSSGQLKRIAVSGGTPEVIADLGSLAGSSVASASGSVGVRGLSWGLDETLMFGTSDGIWRTAADGSGGPKQLVEKAPSERIRSPQLLPDGDSILFSSTTGAYRAAQVVVQSLSTQERTIVLDGEAPLYLSTGHLVFVRQGRLYAASFDTDRLEAGEPFPLQEGFLSNIVSGVVQYAVSGGALVYIPARPSSFYRTMAWVDRSGQEEILSEVRPSMYHYPRISPDGTRAAIDDRNEDNNHGEISILEFDRTVSAILTTEDTGGSYPVWLDDQRIAYSVDDDNRMVWRRADGTGGPQLILETPGYPSFVSPSGDELVYKRPSVPGMGEDIFKIALTEGAEPEPMLATEYDEGNAELSPNGRWMVFQSNRNGQQEMPEVYVAPWPGVTEFQRKISLDGGKQPVWSRDGTEIFYVLPDSSLMAVVVDPQNPSPTKRDYTPLPNVIVFSGAAGRHYDVSLDGKRFLTPVWISVDPADAPEAVQPTWAQQINVVRNWVEELKARVPVR